MRRVQVLGIEGVHEVLEEAEALSPPHKFLKIRLAPGTAYGRHMGGDTIGVEEWRCRDVGPSPIQPPQPVDLEDFPCSPA